MPDEAILADLGQRMDHARRTALLTDEELAARGGISRVVIAKFRSGSGGISLKTFIRILRGLGLLGKLEALFTMPDDYRPSGSGKQTPSKRVRHPRKPRAEGFTWNEDR